MAADDARAATAPAGREALWDAVRSVLAAERSGPALVRADRSSWPPASFAQRRLWYLEQLEPGTPVYNQTVAYRMTGTLDVGALERSVGEIVARHEALRTTLARVDGELVQRIHPPMAVPIPVVEVLASDDADRATRDEARRPFDLETPPLLRLLLLRSAEREHRLVLTVHHLAFDGWSFDVFMRELCELYRAFAAGATSPLAALPVQYADVALWQLERSSGEARRAHLDYWTARLQAPRADLALPIAVPTSRPRNDTPARAGALETARLPRASSDALQALARAEGATPFIALLAVFQTLLHRYSGADDVIVGSPIAQRSGAGVDKLIGLLVNTLVLRTSLEGEPSFRELVRRTRETVLGAYAHQDLPFDVLVDALAAQSAGEHRGADTRPLFRTMFAYQNVPRSAWSLPGIDVEAWNVDNGTAKFDLTLFAWDTAAGLELLLEYDAALFDRETALDLIAHFRTLLEAIVVDPDVRIAELPMLTEAQRRSAIAAAQGPVAAFAADASIHRMFEAQADRTPDAVALVCGKDALRYAELDRRANRLARHLREAGVVRGARVAVCLPSSPALIVALLAILKAGGAYVPIDPTAPPERRRSMLDAAGVSTIVDGSDACVDAHSDARLDIDATRDALACVMFTSGSTGRPKGARIAHRGIVRLVCAASYADLGPQRVFLQLAPVAFDASTFEIWGALLNGARLVLLEERRPSLADIARTVERNRVDILWLTSGLFEVVVDSAPEALDGIEQLLIGGDVVSVPHARRFLERNQHCTLVNCYGPTENTTFTTFHRIDRASIADGVPIPIGRPIANTQVHVLDSRRRPVPFGVAGEAFIGGDGVMLGYAGEADATGDRLIPSPLPDVPGMLYRTGDFVRCRRDGTLEFVGRVDEQVKVRGMRVEPADVEAALRASPDVRQAAVVAHGAGQARRLIAYVVPQRAGAAAAPRSPASDIEAQALSASLRAFLRRRLPDALIPSRFVLRDRLPLSASGKIDRSALVDPGDDRPEVEATAAFVGPRDELEADIAKAYAETLGVAHVGANDDFFDLGGTSLGALRLVASLEQRIGVELPLATLYEAPTVAQLAAWMRDRPRSATACSSSEGPAQAFVTLKRGNPRAPMFLVPGGHGGNAEMTLYAQALRHLDRDIAVYGLLARGVEDADTPHASVAEMARAYVASIRELVPDGPYALAGECVGGVIALEMAQQLAAQGQEVALLLLMDTWLPTALGKLHYRWLEKPGAVFRDRRMIARRGFADVRRVFDDHVRARPRGKPLRALRYAVDVALTMKRVADPWMRAVYDVGKPLAGQARRAAAEANYVEQTLRYAPRPYPGRIALLASAANAKLGIDEPWRRIARGGLSLYCAPGDHDTYLREHPAATAAVLARCVDDALGHREGAANVRESVQREDT